MRAFSSPSFGRRAQVCQPAPAVESSASHGGRGGAMVSSEDAVKILTARIEDISSRLSVKDEMACQQSRLAKDAVEDLIKKDEQVKKLTLALKEEMSAREKAEAACRLSKLEYDKMCQQRSIADSRTIHLNVAFKESLEELKHAKTQLEQKTQEAYSDKKECEKLRNEVEAENRQLKVQLMEVTAESIAISKSLQERARSLNEITETRAKVESESKILQVQLESLRKDVDAHKYEIHVLKKELQLRKEEKEQSKRIAEGMHKRHLENVKKIAKLDSECNRLRALVRKRLSGPVGIAQMRVEADLVGKKRIASPKQTPDQKEMEPLTDRLLAMEDETKLLKESLVKKTAELQAARQLCARTASKLSTAEHMIEAAAKRQSVSAEEKMVTPSSLKESTPQHSFPLSPAGMRGGGEIMEVMDCALSSEDGTTNDDELSCAESWASALIVELAHLRKGEGNLSINVDTGLQDCLEKSQSGNSGDVVMTIDDSNEKTENSKEECGERETISKAVLRKIIEAISVLGQTAIRESLLSEDEGTSAELQLVADGLKDGHSIENLSEVVISELLCRLGHLLNEHCCFSSCVPANGMKGNMNASGSQILETDDLRVNIEPTTSISDEFGGVMENNDLTGSSFQENIDMAEDNRDAQETDADPGSSNLGAEDENKVHSAIDQKCECDSRDLSINKNMSTPLRDLTLQIKCLQQEAERLTADRDELAAKLAHSQVELDEQRSRVATLDAESLLLASEKANLAQQLSQAALRNQDHLTEASASFLEVPRQQVSSVTSEKAHPPVPCQDSEDTAESMPSDAGTTPKDRSQVETEADQKSLALQRKENEIASAKAQLAECQRTILELGSQLRAMSSAGGHAAEEPSFDSSLESAASTDAMNPRQTEPTKGEAFHGFDRLGPRSGGCRRSFQAGYVRTRGGRLVSTEQCWGSSGDMSAVCSDTLPGRYFLTSRNSYGATCPQSPLYEYVSDRPAYVYSPPDTALSSPSASPGRFNSQLKGPPVCSNVLKMTTTALPAGTVLPSPPAPSPSPAKKPSRIARLFSRAKN